MSWGAPGSDPGEFNLPHSVCTDKDGYVYVADRENHRIQIFDSNGKLQTIWHNLHRPCGFHIEENGEKLFYVGELPPQYPFNRAFPNLGPWLSIYNEKRERIARLGDGRWGDGPQQFVAPHGVAVDSHGDVYVGEVSWTSVGKNLEPPRELPCFRKLIRKK
jgi:DNA-binding beta-propeller fold protein YncE